jgi:hypothetical protein
MARLERPLGVKNGMAEPRLQIHLPERTYIGRTLVQDGQEVPMRVFNATHRDQKLTRGPPLAHCEPVTLVTPPNLEQPKA